jgi:hypothetical protein
MVEADGMNCFYSAEASSSSGMVATWGETLTVKSSSSSFSSSFFNRFDYENEDDDEDETGTLILSSDRVPDAFAMLGNAPGTWPDDSGATPDASKTCPDVSGTRPDVSGTCPDVSGTCPDASGTSPDAPPTVGSPPPFLRKIAILSQKRDFSAQAGILLPFRSLLCADRTSQLVVPAKTSSGHRERRPLYYPEDGPRMDFTSDLRSTVSSG